jgi:hypothetical protein
MVAHLHKDGLIAWCSVVTPCIGIFLPFFVEASVPEELAQGAATFTAASPWWRVKRLLDHAAKSWAESFPRLRAHWQEWQQVLLREATKYRDRHAGACVSPGPVRVLSKPFTPWKARCSTTSWNRSPAIIRCRCGTA